MRDDILDASLLRSHLKQYDLQCFVLPTIDSTNLCAKRYFNQHPAQNAVFFAREQTGAIGRFKRAFFAPRDQGLYMSVMFVRKKTEYDPLVTLKAALAVVRALKAQHIQASIKWVNDVFLQQKKICGILCQTFFSDTHQALVIGIGINLYENQHEFPATLTQHVSSVFALTHQKLPVNPLAIAIIEQLTLLLQQQSDAIVQEYKDNCFILGTPITLHPFKQEPYTALAVDIREDGALIVQKQDGTLSALCSAEVSLHKETLQ